MRLNVIHEEDRLEFFARKLERQKKRLHPAMTAAMAWMDNNPRIDVMMKADILDKLSAYNKLFTMLERIGCKIRFDKFDADSDSEDGNGLVALFTISSGVTDNSLIFYSEGMPDELKDDNNLGGDDKMWFHNNDEGSFFPLLLTNLQKTVEAVGAAMVGL